MKQRILFMHHASSIGGGSYCLLNVVNAVDKTLFEPLVALKGEGPLADELRKLGLEVVFFREMAAIPYNRGFLQPGSINSYCAVARSKKALKHLLEDNKIDVLYLNNMMLCRYLQPARECGCKTVVHVREHWPLDEHIRQLQWARKCVYQYADKMIAINHYSASMFPEKESTIVYDWIDMDSRYKPMPMNEIFGEDMTNKKVFLFTGGVTKIKGGLHVAKAFVSKLTNPDFRLLMLGVDTEIRYDGIKGKIRRVLSSFGVEMQSDVLRRIVKTDSRIVCRPSIYELKDLIRQSYCMLSFFTIPHANLGMAECLIEGTPVVCACTEESQEYSKGAIPELLYPINDADGFISSINSLLQNYSSIVNQIETVRDDIALMFNKEINEKKLKDVLASI